jgi:polyferredoxin
MSYGEATPQQLRSFGLLVGAIFAAISLWPVVWHGESLRIWAIIAAGVLVIPALLMPKSLKLIYRGWMAIGDVLGWINTRIILGIVFYGVVTPIGAYRRWRGYDPMRRGWDPNAQSYRVPREARDAKHMQRQF